MNNRFGFWVRIGTSVLALILSAMPGAGSFFSKADSHTRGPALLEWNPSVRAEGMGGASGIVADDSGALFWNPSALGQIHQAEMVLGYAEEFGEQTRGDLRFVQPVWWGKERRTWGVRVAYASVKPFELIENGSAGETVHPQDVVVGTSYEQPVGPIFVGGTLKGVRQDISVDDASTWAADVGIMGRGRRFRWGTSLLNWGPALQTNNGRLELPTRFVAGGGWTIHSRQNGRKNNAVEAAVQMDAPLKDTPRFMIGVEVSRGWSNRYQLSGRVGYRSVSGETNGMENMTFGFGLARDVLEVNYAYLPQELLGATHRFEMGFKFGQPLGPETRRNTLLSQAESLYAAGRMVRARAAVDQVLAISPHHHKARTLRHKIDSRIATSLDPETLFILGEQALQEKRYETAAGLFGRLVEIDPAYPLARERREQADQLNGAERLAVAEARLKAERLREEQARRTRAQRFSAQKKWVDARLAWEKLLDLAPQDRAAQEEVTRCREELYAVALVAEKKGDEPTAIRFYREAQNSLKTFKDSADRVATLLAREAAQEAASAQRRKEAAHGLYEKGMAAYSAKDHVAAERLFQEALRADPNNIKAAKALERLKEELRRSRP